MRWSLAPVLLNEKFVEWLNNHSNLLPDALAKAKQVQSYLPWEKERYKAPKGFSPEVWWSLLLLVRNPQEFNRSLMSVSGECFTLSFIPEVQRLLHEIDLKCGVNSITFSNPKLKNASSTLFRNHLQRSLYEEAISSSQMEGASTTRAIARQMLIEKRPPRDLSEQMIYNNYKTIEKLEQWKDEPLSEALLFKIHRSITEETLADEKQGRYRLESDNVVVTNSFDEVIFVPPPASLLPERMKHIIEFANTTESENSVFLHPVLKAILLHTLLAYEHPFCDGNGRTARALFSWYLLRAGYWQTSYVSLSTELAKNRKSYDQAYLAMESCHFDVTYNVLVNLRAFNDALQALHRHLNEKITSGELVREHLGNILNARQFELLDHSLRHKDYPYKVAEHANWHHVSLNTARADLIDLERKGYLKQSYQGKVQVFHSTELFTKQFQNYSAK